MPYERDASMAIIAFRGIDLDGTTSSVFAAVGSAIFGGC